MWVQTCSRWIVLGLRCCPQRDFLLPLGIFAAVTTVSSAFAGDACDPVLSRRGRKMTAKFSSLSSCKQTAGFTAGTSSQSSSHTTRLLRSIGCEGGASSSESPLIKKALSTAYCILSDMIPVQRSVKQRGLFRERLFSWPWHMHHRAHNN